MLQLTTTQPITQDGKLYDKLQLSLNISSTQQGTKMVNMRLVPMHIANDGERFYLPEQTKYMPIPDLETEAQNDAAIGAAAIQILQALQALINAKGF